MANLNKVMLIGRLTRNPEPILVRGERAGAKFGFAVNNRKRNQDTQQWEDVPVYLEVEIWNRGESKQADRVLETLRGPTPDRSVKASQVYLEGHLRMDQWTDKDTQKPRSKIVVVVDSFQYLDARQEGMGGGEPMARAPRQAAPARGGPRPATAPAGGYGGGGDYDGGDYDDEPAPTPARGGPRGGAAQNEDDIPF